MSCETCAVIDAEHPDALLLIGGSPDPYSEPYGELRRCPACGAWFCTQRDHSNELFYEAAPPSVQRLTPDRARALAVAALAAARALHDHFAPLAGDYEAHTTARYADELARLEAALAELPPPSDAGT